MPFLGYDFFLLSYIYHLQLLFITEFHTDRVQLSRSSPGEPSLDEHDEDGQEEDTSHQPHTDPDPLCGPAYMVTGVH